MKIKKSNSYKVGVCGVRAILQDKLKSIEFEKGNPVEVDEEQLKKLIALGWGAEVKDDGNAKDINKKSADRVTPTE